MGKYLLLALTLPSTLALSIGLFSSEALAEKPTVYKCVRDETTAPVYLNDPSNKDGLSCKALKTPKSALKKVSSKEFSKLSRARIAKLAKKKKKTK